MNYSMRANLVNIFFVALIFLGPVGYCLYDSSIPPEIGRTVIVLSFLLAAFVIADWYHFYFSNSFAGAFRAMGIGVAMIVVSLAVAAAVSGSSVLELARFEDADNADRLGWTMRFYVGGLGLLAAASVGMLRLAVLRGLGESELPAATDVRQ